jgi:hypothetical protein
MRRTMLRNRFGVGLSTMVLARTGRQRNAGARAIRASAEVK